MMTSQVLVCMAKYPATKCASFGAKEPRKQFNFIRTNASSATSLQRQTVCTKLCHCTTVFSSMADILEPVGPPAKVATNENQRSSLAELPKRKKHAIYETLTEDHLDPYLNVSCYPITTKAEDDMELLSDILHWGERYLHHWEQGTYCCSRCTNPLYSSGDKYKGPCVWPSFRKPIEDSSLLAREVFPYNKYTVTVKEVYCGKCKLFVGHQFEDAKQKGDTHPDARWRQ